MGKKLRKYNQILSCEKNRQGWRIRYRTPLDKYEHTLYIGYTRAEAIYKARREGLMEKRIDSPNR